jgi:hypothetical protein
MATTNTQNNETLYSDKLPLNDTSKVISGRFVIEMSYSLSSTASGETISKELLVDLPTQPRK